MGSSSFHPHTQFLVHSAQWTGRLHRLKIALTLSRMSLALTPVDLGFLTIRLEPPTSRLTFLSPQRYEYMKCLILLWWLIRLVWTFLSTLTDFKMFKILITVISQEKAHHPKNTRHLTFQSPPSSMRIPSVATELVTPRGIYLPPSRDT